MLLRIPILTVALLVALAGLYWLVPEQSLLYFSATDIARGETWRIVSGHFMHADAKHLMWNCVGLAVLGTLIEQHSRRILLAALVTGVIAVSVLLLSPFSQLQFYCGLSGVLNTLLLVALWLEWRTSPSLLVLVIACGSVAKVMVEIFLGVSLVTDISWPPYAWAHLAGLMGGLVVIWKQTKMGSRIPARTHELIQ